MTTDFSQIEGIQSSEWNENLITHLLEYVAEGRSYDRKQQLYLTSDANGKLQLNKFAHHIKSFVMDCITMANTARRRGRPCYIVFGMGDERDYMDNGILYQSTNQINTDGDNECPCGKRPCLDISECEHKKSLYEAKYCQSSSDFEKLQAESIPRTLRNITRKYIEPYVAFEYQFGWLENPNGKLICLSYLVFEPVNYPEPYKVTNNEKLISQLDILKLKPDQCFIRQGESKYEPKADEIRYLVTSCEIPFVSYAQWCRYLSKLEEKIEAEREVSMPIELHELPRQQLVAVTGSENNQEEDIQKVLVEPEKWGGNAIYVEGHGGSGKSTLAYAVLNSMLDRLNIYRNVMPRDSSGQPPFFIPLFVNLSNYDPRQGELDSYIVSMFHGLEFHQHDSFEKIFQDQSLDFIIIFDAVDEAVDRPEENISDILWHFIHFHPHIKCLVFTRPHTIDENTKHGKTYRLKAFEEDQIISRIKASGIPLTTQTSILELLRTDKNILKLLSVPRMLDACISGCKDSESVTLVDILGLTWNAYRAYEHRFIEEGKKLDYDDEIQNVANLYWDRPSISVKQLNKFTFKYRYLQSGLIQIDEQLNLYKFLANYIPEYLIAFQLYTDNLYRCQHLKILNQYQARLINVLRLWSGLCDDEQAFEVPKALVLSYSDSLEILFDIYLERQFDEIDDTEDFQLALYEVFDSKSKESIKTIVSQALNDPSIQIVDTVIKVLHEYEPNDYINEQELLELFKKQHQFARKKIIWPILLKTTRFSIYELIHQLIDEQNPLNEEFILQLIISDDFNWSTPDTIALTRFMRASTRDDLKLKILQTTDDLGWDIEMLIAGDDVRLSNEIKRLRDIQQSILNIDIVNESDSADDENLRYLADSLESIGGDRK